MSDQERPLKDRIWEFTKDISVKVSKKAEKHWKINTLRVEIASIKHRINVKYKELGRFVYESHKAATMDDESYQAGTTEIIDELHRLEMEIAERDHRIEVLEQEMDDLADAPVPVIPDAPSADSSDEETDRKADASEQSSADTESTDEQKPS